MSKLMIDEAIRLVDDWIPNDLEAKRLAIHALEEMREREAAASICAGPDGRRWEDVRAKEMFDRCLREDDRSKIAHIAGICVQYPHNTKPRTWRDMNGITIDTLWCKTCRDYPKDIFSAWQKVDLTRNVLVGANGPFNCGICGTELIQVPLPEVSDSLTRDQLNQVMLELQLRGERLYNELPWRASLDRDRDFLKLCDFGRILARAVGIEV